MTESFICEPCYMQITGGRFLDRFHAIAQCDVCGNQHWGARVDLSSLPPGDEEDDIVAVAPV